MVDIAITLAPSSPYIASPASLASIHPSLVHVRQIGQMPDAQLVAVPNEVWTTDVADDILASLKAADGVVSVNVQELKQRSKRKGDEL
ncbi:hypothetical protein K435DRAFT_780678 [Dendrothele bispora CBS 962.96]|uniref:Uncharacterized protein n=1 Tax=Dendrothele bispora (strain CBS 962.96) TaxID=1314807 RepID=A0A4S8LQ08_DENBC|nr:hypothetical protein K435DRAFT_780678 [Dendrothele bispora CBS 962.96]